MEINNIVIAGAGIMGSSMAQIYAKYFDNVTLYNYREESLKKAEDRIKENVETLVKSSEMDKEVQLLKKCPAILQMVSLKEIASYLKITPIHMSRIRRKQSFDNKK